MHLRGLCLGLVMSSLSAVPLWASDACDDLWFTRNAIMDRAGYCFGSSLGKAIFDNTGCTGKSVALDEQAKQAVRQVQRLEKRIGCQVNTSGQSLDLEDLHIRRQLWHLPLLDELESACLGWLGPATPLSAGHSSTAPQVGLISPGDTIVYTHIPVGSWSYVTTHDANWRYKSAGWLDLSRVTEHCRQIAG